MTTRTVIAAAVALGAGVLAGGGRAGLALPLSTLTLAALVVCALARRHRATAAAVMAVVAVGVAGAADAAWRARADGARLLPRLAAREAKVEACGTVLERGARSVSAAAGDLKGEGSRWRVREPVRIAPEREGPPLRARPGERACATGTLRPARSPREPPLLVAARFERKGTGSRIRLWAGAVRDRFRAAALRVLPPRQAGLLLGMTDGDTTLLDEGTLEAFRTTGLAHLVAVSGANVAVVLAIVMAAVRLLVRRGRWVRVAVAGPPVVFFAFLTNLEPSVLRAVVTAGVVLAVAASGRTAEGLRTAALAFIGLVAISPALLRSPGFQLSFAATIGLILWSGPISDRLARWFHPGPPRLAATLTATALGTTLAAQLAVAPLLALHFGRIPAFGGVANLLVAPLAPIVTIGGLLTLGVAAAWSGLGVAPALMRLPVDAILAAGRGFAALPGASVSLGPLAAVALTSGAAAGLAKAPRVRALAVALAVAAGSGACGRAVAVRRESCGGGEVRVIDVGQGTAVLLRSGGRAVLVDGGPESGRVVRALRDLGVRHLDLAIISHPHADHTEGLAEALRRMPVGELVGPATMSWGVGRALLAEAKAGGVPVRVVAAGDRLRAGDGIVMDVVAPEPGPEPPPSDDAINAMSLVVRAKVGKLWVLLPGDLDVEGSSALLESGRPVGAPVLVAPHHGSADVDTEFVDAVGAKATIVTVGSQNRYGHPTRRALRIYRRRGPVLRTDRDGSIVACGGGSSAEIRRAA